MKSSRKQISQRRSKSRLHVVPRGTQGWVVKSNGGESGVRYFQTKEKAVAYSRDEAKSQGGELVIHGRSGKILKHHTYSAEQAGAAGPGAAKAGFGGAKELIVIKDDFESPIEDLSEYV